MVTVTLQVAVLPFAVVTVMVALPAPTAVTLPLLTVATLVFDDFQVTFLFVALEGDTVAARVELLPSFSERVVIFSETPVG